MQKVIVITGPTAVGKTKLSIEIAKRLHTDIINTDAYQVYRKMDIGTAKPTMREQNLVKHHFIDIIDPKDKFSVYNFEKKVRILINKMQKDNKIPLLVGGSGLYIDAVIKNYHFDEEKRIDAKFDDISNETLYQMLVDLDKSAAEKIHPNNRKRLIRAIELAQSPISKDSRSQNKDFYYDTLLIFLNDNRDALYERINQRVDQMISDGLIEEVKAIQINHFSRTSKVAIGYKEIISYLNGDLTKEEAIALIKKNSRHYAKRQFTWFKNKTAATIVNIDTEHFDKTIDEVENLIKNFLS